MESFIKQRTVGHEHPDIIHHFALCPYYQLIYRAKSFSRHHFCTKLETQDPGCTYPYLDCPVRKYGNLVLASEIVGEVIEG